MKRYIDITIEAYDHDWIIRYYLRNRTVQRRGFKSSLLSTARGFGKRASMFERGIIPTTAIGFGKRSDPMQRRHDMLQKDINR